jgi:hypothetical protein
MRMPGCFRRPSQALLVVSFGYSLCAARIELSGHGKAFEFAERTFPYPSRGNVRQSCQALRHGHC